MSWFPVAHRLAEAGAAIARAKGKRMKALRRYRSGYAKTDLADAHVLAAILDACSRKAISYALSQSLDTELALAAVVRRKPPAGCIHHTDRGCQGGFNRSRNTFDHILFKRPVERFCWSTIALRPASLSPPVVVLRFHGRKA